MRHWFMGSLAIVLAAPVAIISACQTKPSIDGASVPKIGSEASIPTCPDVCNRLASLCGYAPADCVTACEDYDDNHRLCVGQATSCQEALESCATEETDGGEEEAGEEDGGEEGGDEDAATEDAATEDAADASDASSD